MVCLVFVPPVVHAEMAAAENAQYVPRKVVYDVHAGHVAEAEPVAMRSWRKARRNRPSAASRTGHDPNICRIATTPGNSSAADQRKAENQFAS